MTRFDTTHGIRRKWTLVGVALALPVFVAIPSRLATALFLVDVVVFAVAYGFVVAWPCPRPRAVLPRGDLDESARLAVPALSTDARGGRAMIPRTILLLSVVGWLAGCSSDPRCSLRPPPDADYGLCDLRMVHWAYFPELGACAAPDGCGCDPQCQANELPFSSREECEAVCME